MYRKALTAFKLPFRAVWLLIQIAGFLLASAEFVLVVTFVGYWIVLTFSYAFLPLKTTENIWQWAANHYDRSIWFKAATISAFLILLLPILRFWPERDPISKAARERDIRLNEGVIAARQQDEARAKLRGR